MLKIGTRVGAIRSSDEKMVYMYGFGRLVGMEIPPSNNKVHGIKMPNPKIELDDGTIVWGKDCWWGEESEIVDLIGNRKVKMVDLSEYKEGVTE